MTNSIYRSLELVKHFYPKDGVSYRVLQPPMTNLNGLYLMNFSIGTPKVDNLALLDTGSDLVWVQCQPCKKCFNQIYPIFNPSKSKTYKAVLCGSQACKLIKQSGCKKTSLSIKCQYKESYGDGSVSSGDVAQETFTFGTNIKNSPAVIDKIIFGCGHDNQGHYNPKSAGIVGLGNGATSLTSQLGSTIDNKFSYCLAPESDTPSFLSFGEKAVVSGPGTVSTPLISGRSSSHYYVNFKGMTVAGKRLDFTDRNGYAGNMVLDTGSTFTFLPTNFYNKLESLVASQINLQPIRKSISGQRLCYESSPFTFKAPPIIVHFLGADIVLNTQQTFGLLGGLMCFHMDIDNDVFMLGNTAQTNFHVGIDRQKKVVSFKPTECSKLQS